METTCTQCHAVLASDTTADWCPACGSALQQQASLPAAPTNPPPEIDHRGIVLPRRHALGGIITPQ
jgi:predicted amidophosphoribosyltransferase